MGSDGCGRTPQRAVADLVACRPPVGKLHLSDFEDLLDVCANALLPLFVR